MAIYGLKEYLDNQVATIVVAADTVQEFNDWFTQIQNQEPDDRHFVEIYTNTMLDALTRPEFKGFKHHVYAFFHENEEARDKFVEQQGILLQQSMPARDRQADMLHRHKEDVREQTETEEDRNKTIEEKYGLDQNDPWDRRSEEEREGDKKMKEELARLRKAGDASGDSFGGADDLRAARKADRLKEALAGKMSETMAREQLKEMLDPSDADFASLENADAPALSDVLTRNHIEDVEVISDAEYDKIREEIMGPEESIQVTDVKASVGEDGTVNVETVTARKFGGEVDTDLKAEREQDYQDRVASAKGSEGHISPDVFADALRGDGRGDAVVHREGDKATPKAHPAPVSRPSLRDHETSDESRETPKLGNVREVTLTPKMWEDIDALVASGEYTDISEVIREAVRSYRKAQ